VDPAFTLGLEPTDDSCRWRLPVRPALTTRHGFLFGGVALAAAVTAAEQATERALVWATAQYLDYARPPADLDLDVTLATSGRQTSQVRVTGSVEGTEIVTVNAALGSRPLELGGTWAQRPDVPPPLDCPLRPPMPGSDGTRITERLEIRVASDTGRIDGRTAAWARVPGLATSTTSLAILGDMVPFGIRMATGMTGTSNSLDNTLRVVRLVPSEWVLLDIRVAAVDRGYGHGIVHQWAEDGTLLATASQSAIVRPDKG
jgi:acyl-CoA thioesterase II